MKRVVKYLLFLVLAAMVVACGPKPNSMAEYEIEGPCSSCPSSRLASILEDVNGVVDVKFNKDTTTVTISYDSTFTPIYKIINMLNVNGYDIDDYLGSEIMYPCCKAMADNGSEIDPFDDPYEDFENSLLDTDDIFDDIGDEQDFRELDPVIEQELMEGFNDDTD